MAWTFLCQKFEKRSWNVKVLGVLGVMSLCLTIPITVHQISKVELPTLTIVCNNGRLGNQMFTYATLIGVARFNHRKPLVPSCNFKELEKYFEITHDVIDSSLFQNSHKHSVSVQNLTVPLEESIFTVKGFYPVAYVYFDRFRNEVLREFRFVPHVSEYADGVLRKLRRKRPELTTFVGVHVRKGDFHHHLCALGALHEASPEFYLNAMEIFRKKYSKVAFVVVSDDLGWTKANVQGDDVYYVGNKTLDPVFDMAVLARCNHTIFAYGTFGFWAAYLSGGDAIYLAGLRESNPQMDKTLRGKHVYLPDWIATKKGTVPLKCENK